MTEGRYSWDRGKRLSLDLTNVSKALHAASRDSES